MYAMYVYMYTWIHVYLLVHVYVCKFDDHVKYKTSLYCHSQIYLCIIARQLDTSVRRLGIEAPVTVIDKKKLITFDKSIK